MHNVQCINKCQGQSKLSLLGGEDSGDHDQWDSNYVPFVFTLESPEIFPSCFIFYFFTEVWITLHGNIKKSFFKKMRYVLLFTSYMWLEPVFFLFQHGDNDPQAVASWSLHSQINVPAAPGCQRSGNGQGK